jgi:hypothetical protein
MNALELIPSCWSWPPGSASRGGRLRSLSAFSSCWGLALASRRLPAVHIKRSWCSSSSCAAPRRRLFTSWRTSPPIAGRSGSLRGAVVATTTAVAWGRTGDPGMSWPVAAVLAIVPPPDAVAARRRGHPAAGSRAIVTILRGEPGERCDRLPVSRRGGRQRRFSAVGYRPNVVVVLGGSTSARDRVARRASTGTWRTSSSRP